MKVVAKVDLGSKGEGELQKFDEYFEFWEFLFRKPSLIRIEFIRLELDEGK